MSNSRIITKSRPPDLESSSIQTIEPILNCHTILEMGSLDLSPNTFGSGFRFWKGPKMFFFKVIFRFIF